MIRSEPLSKTEVGSRCLLASAVSLGLLLPLCLSHQPEPFAMLRLHDLFCAPKVTQNRLSLCSFLNLSFLDPLIDMFQRYALCPEATEIAGWFVGRAPDADVRTSDGKERSNDDQISGEGLGPGGHSMPGGNGSAQYYNDHFRDEECER